MLVSVWASECVRQEGVMGVCGCGGVCVWGAGWGIMFTGVGVGVGEWLSRWFPQFDPPELLDMAQSQPWHPGRQHP